MSNLMESPVQARRTSLYLVRRAEAMRDALLFFAEAKSDPTRRLQFLAQSDFWEWELDNLVYSFTNLRERSATWQSEAAASAKLLQLGLKVDGKRLARVRWNAEGRWSRKVRHDRVAPVELLREVIDAWNELIGTVEAEFVEPMRASADRWNIQTRRDLASLRKAMPDLAEMSG